MVSCLPIRFRFLSAVPMDGPRDGAIGATGAAGAGAKDGAIGAANAAEICLEVSELPPETLPRGAATDPPGSA